MPSNQPVLLRCSKDRSPLVLATGPEGEVFAICLECAAGWKAEEVTENSAGLVAGLFTEEQIASLREQYQIARKEGG